MYATVNEIFFLTSSNSQVHLKKNTLVKMLYMGKKQIVNIFEILL